ncbi:MAG: glycerol-3-phosphate dehydrogenase/oxidase, partial [Actinomycetota bacterium]|nr:glycerol-3-phosphate dehydrogenase/oxidase [Actinomycetota bacterium]
MTFDRSASLQRLADERFDVLVVGGGITGAGVALDAASRGLRTALVERRDLASGTSSKSSKLVHGGLRYLQQREFRLVYEALAERQRLRRNAPHLVRLLPFLIPMFGKGGVVNPKLAKAFSTALWLYDLTGGARIGKLHERISAADTMAHMPTLDPAKVVSGYVYYDAHTDDARLTLAVARTAADHGAAVANWCPVVDLTRDGDGVVRGAVVRPAEGEVTIAIRAEAVVNATGVWSDEVRALEDGLHPGSLRPAKGIHITVPWTKVRNDIAAVVPVPRDRRSVFVVPQGDRTYIGTTDTDYDGPLDDPRCTAEDVEYLLSAINFSVVEPLTTDDVLGTWAGLRPLVRTARSARTADLSRRHSVTRSGGGLVTVTGGKLTTYRRMSADAVDAVVEGLGRRGRSRTRKLALHGAEGFAPLEQDGAAERLGLAPEVLAHLAGRHGGEARTLAALVAADPALGRPLVEGLPHLRAEAVHAARYEMARTLDDVLSRRIPARWLAGEASVVAAEDTARLVGPELGWSEGDAARE